MRFFGRSLLDVVSLGLPGNLQRRLINYALARLLGSFVNVDLTTDDLELKFRDGSLSFTNVDLRTDHINSKLAGLGFSLRSGRIALLRIVIPWSNLLSGQFSILASGLDLVVCPDETAGETPSDTHDYSEALAESVADITQSFIEDEGLDSLGVADQAPESALLQRMLGTILSNLSVEISQFSVHLVESCNTQLVLSLTTIQVEPLGEREGWDLHLQGFKASLLGTRPAYPNMVVVDTSIAQSTSSSTTSASSYTDAMLMQSTILSPLPQNDESMYMSATSGMSMTDHFTTTSERMEIDHMPDNCCILECSTSITGSLFLGNVTPALELSCGPMVTCIEQSQFLKLSAFMKGFLTKSSGSAPIQSLPQQGPLINIKLEAFRCSMKMESGEHSTTTPNTTATITFDLRRLTMTRHHNGEITIDLASLLLSLGSSRLMCASDNSRFGSFSFDTNGSLHAQLEPLRAELELDQLSTLTSLLSTLQTDLQCLLESDQSTIQVEGQDKTRTAQLECSRFVLVGHGEHDVTLDVLKPILHHHSDAQKVRTSLCFESFTLEGDGQNILCVDSSENSNVIDHTKILLKSPQPTLEFISYESLFGHRERDYKTEQSTLKALKEKSKALSDVIYRASLGKLCADLDSSKLKLINDMLSYGKTFLHHNAQNSDVALNSITSVTLLLTEIAEVQLELLLKESRRIDMYLKKASLFHVTNLKQINAAALDVFDINVTSSDSDAQAAQLCKAGLHTTGSAVRSLPMFAARYRQNLSGRRKGSEMIRLAFADVQLEYYSKMSWLGALNELYVDLRPESTEVKPTKKNSEIAIDLTNVSIGLNPYTGKCKGLIYFKKSVLEGNIPLSDNAMRARFHAGVVDLFLIDDIDCAQNDSTEQRRQRNDPVTYTLLKLGFVRIASVETAEIVLAANDTQLVSSQYELNIVGAILTLHTCADSLATFLTLINTLRPPVALSDEGKYKLAATDEQGSELNVFEGIEDYTISKPFTTPARYGSVRQSEQEIDNRSLPDISESVHIDLPIQDPRPAISVGEVLHDRRSHENIASVALDSMSQSVVDLRQSVLGQSKPLQKQLLTVKTQKCFIVWNIHDGYDWDSTRSKIAQAIEHALEKAQTQDNDKFPSDVTMDDLDGEPESGSSSEIGDLLFNSIYISLPAGAQREDVARAINDEIAVADVSDTATQTTYKGTSSQHRTVTETLDTLRLGRSKMHKVRIEVSEVDLDLVVSEPDDDTGVVANTTISIHDLEIIDNVSTSTWHKFLTYDRSVGARDERSRMAHLNIFSVKPMASLAAAELAVEVVVAPLRLHVDQDTLEFLTRFFEFKDENAAANLPPPEETFFQKVEVLAIPIQIDYKPKRLDFKSLRSGRTTELKNLFILEESKMFLKHVILYGICGTSRVFQSLNDVWLNHIKATQLSNVLAGVSAIRSFASFSGGLKKLVMEPISEYRKDGRLVPGMKRGIGSFVKTTGNEAVRLGAKLAIGTQGMLEIAEHAMSDTTTDSRQSRSSHAVSMYADQPNNLRQGISQAIGGMSRHVGLAKEALASLPREFEEETDARRVATAAAKSIPVAVLRPLIGTTEMISKTLLGLRNTMNPEQRRLNDDKYKHTD